MNQERTPPTKEALASALTLSEEILKNIEHSEIPLTNIALKTSRLARLLNEPMYQKMMEYEAGGYPATPDKAPRQEIWDTAIRAGRRYTKKDKTSGEVKEFVYRESIAELEDELRIGESSLAAAHDPDISIASSNPHQFVSPPSGNIMERNYMRQMIWTASQRLSSRRALIYNYVLQKYHQLKFSTITADIFTKIRYTVDSSLSKITPKSAIEFPLVYEKMKSDNPEDWVGCVFICRKIFHELANKLYPTRKDDKVIKIAGTEKTIKLGKDDYINRLVAFVEENSKLERFIDITRASLFAIGEQLDDIFAAAQQGSQENIVSREEAERFVVQTYILVGDIIMLMPKEDQAESAEKNKPGEIEEIQPNAPETEQTTLDKNASKGPTEKS